MSGGEYVAMGSSFAAGPGLTPRVADSPRLAGRSTINYAHLVAAQLGLSLVDVTYSGATIVDLLEGTAEGTAPQVDAVGPATRLVTITGGGNDVGYLPGLTLPSLPWPLVRLPRIRRTAAASIDAAEVDARFVQLDGSLRKLLRAVHDRAPEAIVMLVDYLTILPPDPAVSTGPLPGAVAAWGRSTASRLTALLQSVAAEEGAIFVASGAASLDHSAWAAQPWTRQFHLTLRGGAAYHPNAAGMRAVAAIIARDLQGMLAGGS